MSEPVATVDVANMALAHVGAKGRIAQVDERTTENQRVQQFWRSSLEATLRAFDWNFARRYVVAAPLAEAPPKHWDRWYAYPEHCLRVVRLYPQGYKAAMDHLVSGGQFGIDTGVASGVRAVPFEIVATADGHRAVATHNELPTIRYTRYTESAELWDPLFSDSFAYQLAMRLVPSLAPATGRAQRVQDLVAQFRSSLEVAQAVDASEGYEDHNREAPWVGLGM